MDKHLKLLGMEVRDRVTGYAGVVTSISFDLYGCVQAVVQPQAADGKVDSGQWFDEKRLEVIGEKPVMPVPDFVHVPGPAAKPGFTSQPLR